MYRAVSRPASFAVIRTPAYVIFLFFGKKNLHIKLAKFVLGTVDKNLSYKFSISHSNCLNEGEELVDYIQNNIKNIVNIDLVDMGSGLGVHAGPGSFGVAYQLVCDE